MSKLKSDTMLDLDELCEILHVSKTGEALRKIRADPRCPRPVRIGRKPLFFESEVFAYLKARRDRDEAALYSSESKDTA